MRLGFKFFKVQPAPATFNIFQPAQKFRVKLFVTFFSFCRTLHSSTKTYQDILDLEVGMPNGEQKHADAPTQKTPYMSIHVYSSCQATIYIWMGTEYLQQCVLAASFATWDDMGSEEMMQSCSCRYLQMNVLLYS